MQNIHTSIGVSELVRKFVDDNGGVNDTAETIASKLISAVLHWTSKAAEHDGDDGRKIALAAARRGLTDFIGGVHTVPGRPRPECYTLITVRLQDGLWVAETGYEEMIQ